MPSGHPDANGRLVQALPTGRRLLLVVDELCRFQRCGGLANLPLSALIFLSSCRGSVPLARPYCVAQHQWEHILSEGCPRGQAYREVRCSGVRIPPCPHGLCAAVWRALEGLLPRQVGFLSHQKPVLTLPSAHNGCCMQCGVYKPKGCKLLHVWRKPSCTLQCSLACRRGGTRESAGYLGVRGWVVGLLPPDRRSVGLVGSSQLFLKYRCCLLGILRRLHEQHSYDPKTAQSSVTHVQELHSWLKGD